MLHILKPFQIAARLDVMLDEVVGEEMDPTAVFNTQPSVLRHIELQAAWYPKYNAFSTLPSHQLPRTPPSNIVFHSKPKMQFRPLHQQPPPFHVHCWICSSIERQTARSQGCQESHEECYGTCRSESPTRQKGLPAAGRFPRRAS